MHDLLAPSAPATGTASRTRRVWTAALATAAGAAVLAGLSSSILTPSRIPAPSVEPAPAAVAGLDTPDAPTGPEAAGRGEDAGAHPFPAPDALRTALSQPTPAEATTFALLTPLLQRETADEAAQQVPPQTAPPQTVPLPVPRPSEFRPAPRRAERSRRVRTAVAPVQTEDDRSFFEKFFGIERKAAPALAYAALETNGAVEAIPRRPLAPAPSPAPSPAPQSAVPGAGVAVYDITARTVTLPSGERLEAHSGLGAYMDDPRYVHEKMRGATPPGTYDLTEREALFHGVRAIRLTPVGGSEAIHGRAGLLAHTYMLGPQGASNGCISFRDYARFLQAFLNGEVQRVVVVAGARGQDPISAIFASR